MMCVKISTAPPQAERDVRPSGANPGESGIFFLWFNCITFEDSIRDIRTSGYVCVL